MNAAWSSQKNIKGLLFNIEKVNGNENIKVGKEWMKEGRKK